MKDFTKYMLMLFALFFVANTAMASDDLYAWFYTEFHAYPSGAGKIYVDDSNQVDESTITDWSEGCERKSFGFTQINAHDYYIYTQGNDGRQCVGVAEATRADEYSDWEVPFDENGNVVFHNHVNQTYPWRYYYASQDTDKDETVALSKEPLFPTHCCFAIFSSVGARFAEGHKAFAQSVTCTPTVNNIGDNITLTATPADERCHFAYWLNEKTGEKFTENPLYATVTAPTSYVAYFSCDSAIIISNPGMEKTYVWYNKDYCSIINTESGSYESYVMQEPNFTDSLDVKNPSKRLTFVESSTTDRGFPAAPTILKVKNEVIMLPSPGMNAFSSLSDPFLFWSGEAGLVESDMNPSAMYYLVDTDKNRLYLTTEKSIAPNTAYAAIYNDQLYVEEAEAPQYIYWSEKAAIAAADEDPAGITTTQIEDARKNGEIYNINGIQMTKIAKGIYIMNGKKFIAK